jgi:glycosyltransferase involved in cell wall biosynthesis
MHEDRADAANQATPLRAMSQLHIVVDLSVRSGGQALAALQYAQSVALAGANVTLFVVNHTADLLALEPSSESFRVVYPKDFLKARSAPKFLGDAQALWCCVAQGTFDVLHIHGTWSPILAVAAGIARARNLPYLISPHGCLEPWALQHRHTKKVMALALYQSRVFRGAKLLVATAQKELKSIRNTGLETPVAVIPLGVDLPAKVLRSEASSRSLLFMSRIHPIKGLLELVSAWAQLRPLGWSLIIAGPDEGGYEAVVRARVHELGLDTQVLFTGLASGAEKERLFAECDVFVLPSHSENFGMVVAEALARSVPVITTKGTPWELLEQERCGWWVSADANALAAALRQAFNLTKAELNEMGERGRQLVEKEFAWEKVGKMALSSSQWALDRSLPLPQFIDAGRF